MALRGSDLREALIGLDNHARRDLTALWRDVSDAASAREPLNDILPALIDTYGIAAATLAADWYDDLRNKLGVRRSFSAIPAHFDDPGAEALIGWAITKATDLASLQTLVEGGLQRRVANFARATVAGSSIADPSARGWQRVGAGECRNGFCDMLIGRGAVYSEASADFAAHDNCKCVAVPAFDGEPRPVRPFTPSTRNVSDADRARVHDWLATH